MLAIVDTRPLVAFFDRSERHHNWVVQRIDALEAPLLVCEPVLAEAMYLLARHAKAQDVLFELQQKGALTIAFGSRSTSRVCIICCEDIGTHRCR